MVVALLDLRQHGAVAQLGHALDHGPHQPGLALLSSAASLSATPASWTSGSITISRVTQSRPLMRMNT